MSTLTIRTEDALLQHILDWYSATSDGRHLVAIAGPPAAGKSTLLENLVTRLRAALSANEVQGLPMDGFHFDNAVLDDMVARDRKGAPHTFDVQGLDVLLHRLKRNESPVYFPAFDRELDLSRNCAIRVDDHHRLLLIEGNYLLLEQPDWQQLKRHYSLSIRIDIPTELVKQRILDRWRGYGLSETVALAKAENNDLPNAELVFNQSMPADIIYRPEL